jgi:uncharacterized protein YidB (DUF937 family)
MALLDNLLGVGRSPSGTGMSPLTMALLGVLAYRVFQGNGRLAETLGRLPPGANGVDTGAASPGAWLGRLLGAEAAGNILSGGIGDLFKQFRQNGQGDKALSWIARGPNKSISPSELEQALGGEKIEWLTRETGISREELLSGLSRALPETVDKLTPDGRLPTQQEAERLVC